MKSLSRGLSALALVAWGSLLLYFHFSHRLNEYLIPAYRPLAVISGAVMVGMAAILWFTQFLDSRSGRTAALGLDEARSTGRVRATQILSFLLLVAPIWAAGGMSSDSYGARAILNRGISTDASHLPERTPSAPVAVYEPPLPGAFPAAPDAVNPTAEDAAQYLKKTAGGAIIAEVTDLLFAADDDTMRPAFEGKKVELIGQYMPARDGSVSGQRFQLVRMFMVCCAADARPVAVSIEPGATPKLAEMAWTKVTGTATFPMESGHRQVVIRGDNQAPTDPPGETMLY